MRRLLVRFSGFSAGLALAASALAYQAPALAAADAGKAASLTQDDVAWLRRDGFGLSSDQIARYRKLGRNGLLQAQLADRVDGQLPPPIARMIANYPAIKTPISQHLKKAFDDQWQLHHMAAGPEKDALAKAFEVNGNNLLNQAAAAQMLHAIYGPNQLKEQLVWFWLNHFSVYMGAGANRWQAGAYAEKTIRPHALGKFRDLVMATLESPAMLDSLQNTKNVKGKVNENYARELMELQTLGVNGGYTQKDVEQLALILTGAHIASIDGKLKPVPISLMPLMVHKNMFVFTPNWHDFRDKTFLGHTIKGRGYNEVKQAVNIIVRKPQCAQFVSQKLAAFFVADAPPPALVKRMAATFQKTDGDIASVMRVMFESSELVAHSGQKFKDPMRFVVSSMRLALDGQPIINALPLAGYVDQLGEPLFGRVTPDGWPQDAPSWSSSGQMSARFEVARSIGSDNRALFTPPGSKPGAIGFPQLHSAIYEAAIAPYLSEQTRTALASARSPQEWNTYLLASPQFNYW